MELYNDLLLKALENKNINVSFSGVSLDLNQIVETECYKILNQIKAVLEDKNLNDAECFEKIEKIVCIFEENCCSISYRHDF